ncbi:hypothetical protein [Egbenema bharatensis]
MPKSPSPESERAIGFGESETAVRSETRGLGGQDFGLSSVETLPTPQEP